MRLLRVPHRRVLIIRVGARALHVGLDWSAAEGVRMATLAVALRSPDAPSAETLLRRARMRVYAALSSRQGQLPAVSAGIVKCIIAKNKPCMMPTS